MTEFEALFGLKNTSIKKNVALLPYITNDMKKYLLLKDFTRGILYSVAQQDDFSLIKTGIGASLLGDAVLYLKDTPCKNVILFGSCGLLEKTKDIDIGDIVSPSKSFAIESFTEMISFASAPYTAYYPDSELFEVFKDNPKVNETVCASVGSLKLETQNKTFLLKMGSGVVDMETSGLFSASKHAGIKSAALLYISDIVGEKPFFGKQNNGDRKKILASIETSIDIICKIMKNI